MRVGSHPAGNKLAAKLHTSQRMANFYMGWFFRLYRTSETGWHNYATPDGKAIMHQDAYFWQALEIICRTMNLLISEERNKMAGKAGRKR